jgi:hypothetical protein
MALSHQRLERLQAVQKNHDGIIGLLSIHLSIWQLLRAWLVKYLCRDTSVSNHLAVYGGATSHISVPNSSLSLSHSLSTLLNRTLIPSLHGVADSIDDSYTLSWL